MKNNKVKVTSSNGKEKGICTGNAYHCRMIGCKGLRVGVRWPDGKITFPCTEGMKTYKNGDMKIL